MTVVARTLALSLALASTATAQTRDIVRGRVTTGDNTPIQGATVAVLPAGSQTPTPTRTDARGAYSVTIQPAAASYTVSVQMLGYAPQRRTVTRAAGDSIIPPVDFKLVQAAAQLGAVRSVGERLKPPRSETAADFTPGGGFAFA